MAEANFTLNFDSNNSGIDASTNDLEKLRDTVVMGSKALQEMQATIARMSKLGEVAAFKDINKRLSGADSALSKLKAQADAIKGDLNLLSPKDKGYQEQLGKFMAAQQQVTAQKEKIAGLLKARESLEKTEAVKQYKAQETALKSLEQKLGAAQVKFSAMGGSLKDVAKPTALEGLGNAAKLTGQEVGSLKEKFSALTNLGVAGWTALAIAGFAALAVAVVAAYVAVGVILVKLAAFGVECSDTARSARMLREAVTGGGESLTAVDAAIARVRANVPGTRAEIQGLALDMHKLGLRGNEVVAGTEAIQLANKVLGEQVGGVFKGLIERNKIGKRFTVNPVDFLGTGLQWKELTAATARRMGTTIGAADQALRNGQIKLGDGVEALNSAMQAKFGKFGRGLLLALPEQFSRLKENIGTLFSGLDIDPFLNGLKDVLSIFDETTATGRELKKLVTAIFQPMVNEATSALPTVKAMILDTILTISKSLRTVVTGGGLSMLFTDGKKSAEELYEVVKNILKAINSVAKGINSLVSESEAITQANSFKQEDQVKALGFESVEAYNAARAGKDAGKQITTGVTEGIALGTPDAVKALQELADAQLAGYKERLGIKSPSLAFREESRWIPRGAALGVEDETPLVEQAVADMGSPDAMGARGMVEVKGGHRGGVTVVIEQLVWQGAGSRQDAESFAEMLIEEVEKRVAAQGG